jgi:hypothetical protein
MDWLERIFLWRFLWRDYDTRGRCERFNFLLALRFHFDSGADAMRWLGLIYIIYSVITDFAIWGGAFYLMLDSVL